VWYPSRKGEDVVALHDRIAGFLKVLIPEVQRRFAGAHKRILLVSHAATVAGLTHELLGDRNLSFRVACCSLTVLDRKDAADAVAGEPAQRTAIGYWRARLLGDGKHLKDGLLRSWGFMDAAIADGEVSVVATAISLRCDWT
jgi:transcription factor C subunit 7